MLSLYWSGLKSDCMWCQQNISSIVYIDLPGKYHLVMPSKHLQCYLDTDIKTVRIKINDNEHNVFLPYPRCYRYTGEDQILAVYRFTESVYINSCYIYM